MSPPKASVSDELSSQDIIPTDSFLCSIQSGDSMSRCSLEPGDAAGNPKMNEPFVSGEMSSIKCQSVETKSDDQSPEHSYAQSRTQSASIAISCSDYVPSTATEMSRTSGGHKKLGMDLGEIVSESATPLPSNSLTGRGSHSAKPSAEISDIGSNNYVSIRSPPLSDLGHNETITSADAGKLVEDLKSPSHLVQTSAEEKVRLLAKHNVENRITISKCGAIGPLILLLHSDDKTAQEHAGTALLNLSLNEENKSRIAAAGVIEPLIHVLEMGINAAKENSAAALFGLLFLNNTG